MGEAFEVVFVDSAPFAAEPRVVRELEGFANLTRHTHRFASRSAGAARLVFDRVRQRCLQAWFRVTGIVSAGALSTRAFGLERELDLAKADIYVSHQTATLLPVFHAARRHDALVVFDSMEFHSDMGDEQSALDRGLTHRVEADVLPHCALVLASSAQLADALVQEYGIARPIVLHNVPPVVSELPAKPESGLALYWRNAVMGLGQRGLGDALVALTLLPKDVTLHLQGRIPPDGGSAVKAAIAKLGLTERVVFHAPYAPERAVLEASRHHVGLCLERKGCRNHELTVSNKMFDYHMAGLAVVASDLPGLRGVLERSRGGLLFSPGSPEELAAAVSSLNHDRALLSRLGANARQFALREGNREVEELKFVTAFRKACMARLERELK